MFYQRRSVLIILTSKFQSNKQMSALLQGDRLLGPGANIRSPVIVTVDVFVTETSTHLIPRSHSSVLSLQWTSTVAYSSGSYTAKDRCILYT